MLKNWSTNRNIKRNLRSYQDPRRDLFAKPFPGLTKVLSIILALVIPLASILLAGNIVFRIPDFYNIELSRSAALAKADIDVEEEAIGNIISSYLRGNEDEFQIDHEYHGEKIPLFTQNDQKMMKEYKSFLSATFVILVLMLIYIAVSTTFLCITKWIRRLRKSYLAGLIIYLGILLGSIGIFLDKTTTMRVFNGLIGVSPGREDILTLLFSTQFVIITAGAIVGISLLIMFIGNSLTQYLTKDYRMFE